MNIRNYVIIIAIVFSITSCKNHQKENNIKKKIESVSSDLQIDHLNIWVKNPKKAKARLTDIGFSSVPDSLSPIHKGQGTTGRYFHFFNGYLELIFVYNQNELEENNALNKDLDFIERANFANNGASPFSIALKVKEYNIEKIPFKKVKYYQDWMEENTAIYAAMSSKINLKEPSVFVMHPEMESGRFESLTELENFPPKDASWKEYFKHPNGAEKITKAIITSPDLDITTETIEAVNNIKNLIVKNGKEHLMELHFDDDIQGKSFDLRPELPLIIFL